MNHIGGKWVFDEIVEEENSVIVKDDKGRNSFKVDKRLANVLNWLQDTGLEMICQKQNDIIIVNSGSSGTGNIFEESCDSINLNNGMFIKTIVPKDWEDFTILQKKEFNSLSLLEKKGLLGVNRGEISPYISYIYGWMTDGSEESKELTKSKNSISANLLLIPNFDTEYINIIKKSDGIPFAITLGERLNVVWDNEQYITNRGGENVLSPNNYLFHLEIIHFIYCIANGIKSLNERGLIHNDIKPHNIAGFKGDTFLTIWKLIDLGLISEKKEDLGGTILFKDAFHFNNIYYEENNQQEFVDAVKKDIFALGVSVLYILGISSNSISLNLANLSILLEQARFMSRDLFELLQGMLLKSRKERTDVDSVILKCTDILNKNYSFLFKKITTDTLILNEEPEQEEPEQEEPEQEEPEQEEPEQFEPEQFEPKQFEPKQKEKLKMRTF